MSPIVTQKQHKSGRLDQKGYGLVSGLVGFVFGAIAALVAFRFVFRLLDANADNSIVSWVYNTSEPLVSPFFGIFNNDINVLNGIFEFETLLALAVYAVVGFLVTRLFSGGYNRNRTHSV
jgi:uncharacterized protein YggT (Ycf19 family)